MKKIIVFTFLVVCITKGFAQGVWALDKAHAKLGFSVTHMMISEVEGSFKTFDLKVISPKNDFEDTRIELTADINSINTDNEKRDNHLKTADFFDEEKYPVLSFKSTEFKKTEDTKYKITGNLTMRGVTRWITLTGYLKGTTTHPYTKKTVAGFKVTGTIKRSDFKIGTETPSGIISDEVEINANIEISKE